MAMSETGMKVFEYLKGFVGKKELTINSIGEACGVSPKSVNGVLLSFTGRGLVTRERAIGEDGTVITYVIPQESILTYNPNEVTKKDSEPKYSDSTRAVIKLLKGKVGSSEKFTAQNIADSLSLSVRTVNCILNSLKKKGCIERSEPHGVVIDGKAVNVKYIEVLPAIKDLEV